MISQPTYLLEVLEKKVGKEEAKKIAQTIEIIYNELDKKTESLAQQKKLELKDELTKELATKADLAIMEAKIEKEILKLGTKFTIMFLVLAFLIIFINKESLEFLAKLLGIIK